MEVAHVETYSPGSVITAVAEYEQTKLGADALGERGKPSERVGSEAADRLRPGSRETQYALAEAYQRTGKPEDAINLLEQMLRTNPAEFVAAGQLSTIYQNRGETGKAIQILTQTSQANPQLAPLRSALADLLLTSNMDEEASKEVQEALK
ncbi:tetratricopeptide repeat protein, partial [Acidobacteria bacterium ACD]|nr:tetratricopeptide repeat protein [Acidobacteria bacterium ACD]